MLKELLDMYKGTNQSAPSANGLRPENSTMLDCNCVDSDCAISD